MAALGAASAWPPVTFAQPADEVRKIGVLMPFSAQDPFGQEIMTALRQGLRENGWICWPQYQYRRALDRRR